MESYALTQNELLFIGLGISLVILIYMYFKYFR